MVQRFLRLDLLTLWGKKTQNQKCGKAELPLCAMSYLGAGCDRFCHV